jgi:hypothetical protein
MNACIGSRRYVFMDSQEWLSYFRGETWQDEWMHRPSRYAFMDSQEWLSYLRRSTTASPRDF